MKRIIIILLVCLLSLTIPLRVNAEPIEDKYKNIIDEIPRVLDQTYTMCMEGSEKEQEEGAQEYRRYLEKWKTELKEIISHDPKGIWADDAQFQIVELLWFAVPKQEPLHDMSPGLTKEIKGDIRNAISEMRYFLDNYPDVDPEKDFNDLTRKQSFLISASKYSQLPFAYDLRRHLAYMYFILGDLKELKSLAQETIEKFPWLKGRYSLLYYVVYYYIEHNAPHGLLDLKKGTTKKEILEFTGPYTVKDDDMIGTIPNPYYSEILKTKNKEFEVLYYYYEVHDIDVVTDSDLYPVVLEEGKLIGTGMRFLKLLAKAYDLSIERKEIKHPFPESLDNKSK